MEPKLMPDRAMAADNSADAILSRSYSRMIIPESDGSFRGEMLEFPGCFAIGDTPSEALSNLEDAAKWWIAAALEQGQRIPPPMEDNNGFSGRFLLRVPKSLHKKAALYAEREGVSLNQFVTYSVAETVGERHVSTYMFVNISGRVSSTAGGATRLQAQPLTIGHSVAGALEVTGVFSNSVPQNA